MWPAQPPVQWIMGALSLEVKHPGHEANSLLPCHAGTKNAWRCNAAQSRTFLVHGVLHFFPFVNISYSQRPTSCFYTARILSCTDMCSGMFASCGWKTGL